MDSNSILTESGRNKSLSEEKVKEFVEKKPSEIPSSFFLALAGGAVALALGLALTQKKKSWANFVGQWVPTILLLGIYDKVAMTHNLRKTEDNSMLH